MLKKNILITGGCRSGKSRQALSIADKFSGRKVFIATAEPLDDEMKERITKHQQERGKDWITQEGPLDPGAIIKREGKKAAIIVMDCLTLWVSNMMMKNMDRTSILEKMEELISECTRAHCTVILITNEVGAGIVPDNNLSRSFRDIAGEANQIAASKFDQVVHMVSGIPVTIKST